MVLSGQIRKSAPILRELICGGEHQFAHALPVAAIKAFHVLGERVRVHRDLGMIVRAEKLRAFHADGPITKRCAFGGAGNNADVLGHDLILQSATATVSDPVKFGAEQSDVVLGITK